MNFADYIRPEAWVAVSAALEFTKRIARYLAELHPVFKPLAGLVDGYTAFFLLLYTFVGFGLSGFVVSPDLSSAFNYLSLFIGALLTYKVGGAAINAAVSLKADTD